MTYASGGLIQASDYDNLVGPVTSSATINQLNTVWGIGSGAAGYGQTPIANVSTGDVVTAAQWATMINALNNASKHQSGGTGTGIAAPTAGTVITYLSTLQAAVNTVYTNRALYASSGSTVSLGTKTASVNFAATAGGSASNVSIVSFQSANHARLFFNCGGRIQFVTSSSNTSATGRSNAACSDWNALGVTVSNTTNSITAVGYRGLGVGASTVSSVGSAAPYASTSSVQYIYSASVTDTTNGANGNTVVHQANVTIPADDAFGGTCVASFTTTAYVIYPESTNLTASWGTAPVLS
jgi:hypothetical protein